MNIVSLLAVAAAIILFVGEWLARRPNPPRTSVLALGLALFAGAYLAQNVLQGLHQYVIH